MKRVTALLMLLAGVVAADAAPPAEDVVADLVVGQCLSETRKTALPEGYMDARKIGMPLGPNDRDSRLSKQALRIPTATGAVYYDRAGDYCNVHASGVDAARVLAALERALGRLRLTFSKHNVTHDDKTKNEPGKLWPTLVYLIGTPVDNPVVPVITITPQPRDPGALTVGVAAGR
jgi:hypothetical protein